MINEILTLDDVKQFAKELTSEGLSFHPDDDFHDYINLETKEPTYSEEEAGLRNKLMDKCFEICEQEDVDIYTLMMEEFLLETGLNKIIPLPSNE